MKFRWRRDGNDFYVGSMKQNKGKFPVDSGGAVCWTTDGYQVFAWTAEKSWKRRFPVSASRDAAKSAVEEWLLKHSAQHKSNVHVPSVDNVRVKNLITLFIGEDIAKGLITASDLKNKRKMKEVVRKYLPMATEIILSVDNHLRG